jgi:hypothetical protein
MKKTSHLTRKTLLSMAFVGSCMSAQAALVHQWSFNDDLLDTSGNGNDGVFTGTTETYVAGQFGNAISLTVGEAVDEFAVWDEALNATEVGNLFATNQTIPEPSVMALVGLGGLSLLRRKRR